MDTSQGVKVGDIYAHFKNPGRRYKILHICTLQTDNTETDGQLVVVYLALYGKNTVYVRPLNEWFEIKQLNGQNVPRFTLV